MENRTVNIYEIKMEMIRSVLIFNWLYLIQFIRFRKNYKKLEKI